MQDELRTPGERWMASRRGLLAGGAGIGIAAVAGAVVAAAGKPGEDRGGDGSGGTAHGGIIHTQKEEHGGIAHVHDGIGHTHPVMVHALDQHTLREVDTAI